MTFDGIRPHRPMTEEEVEFRKNNLKDIEMTELDPEIWDNPTLGKAAQNPNLTQIERQEQENRAAKIEDREPREIVVDNDYPGWTPEVNERTGTVSSNYQTVHFKDENPNDIPVDAGRPEEDASTVQDPEENNDPEENPEQGDASPESTGEPVSDPDSSAVSTETTSTPPAEEGNSTKWT